LLNFLSPGWALSARPAPGRCAHPWDAVGQAVVDLISAGISRTCCGSTNTASRSAICSGRTGSPGLRSIASRTDRGGSGERPLMFGLCASRARMREPLPARWPAAPLSRVAPGQWRFDRGAGQGACSDRFWLRYEDILYRQPAARPRSDWVPTRRSHWTRH